MIELFLLMGLLAGLLAVASDPSPYYVAFGLVIGAVVGSLLLSKVGVTFLSLVLMLVYLGGMMVVFAYCTVLAAEPFPEAWGSNAVLGYLMLYIAVIVLFILGVLGFVGWLGVNGFVHSSFGWGWVLSDWLSVSQMCNSGSWMLMFGGLVLLLIVLVALEVVRGHYSGALWAV